MTENSATRTETNREIIRQAFDAWRQGTAAITDVFAPDMVWRIEDTRPHRRSTAAGSSLSMRSWPRSAPGSRCQSHSARSRSARSTPTTSLTDRGLRSAASASSSCVSRASARSCRSSPAKLSAACSATSPASPPHSPGNLPPGLRTTRHRHQPSGTWTLGAAIAEPQHGTRTWTVTADPEGGEFCAFLRPEVPAERLHGLVADSADRQAQARW